jgi:hypothetical protein
MAGTTTEQGLVPGWPGRTVRREPLAGSGGAEGPVPGEGALAGPRWLLVWNRGPDGECCCWRGTVRADGVGVAGNCTNPGKHPWVTRVEGEVYGFAHGANDALEYLELQDRYGPAGGARQLAVTLDGLIVIDIDGERALRDFARLAGTVPREKILGVSSTPRGFHVWLDVPGWDQRSLNLWMSQWLGAQGGWHGTDEKQAGRRGFLIDVRTGVNRFVVWPGEDSLGQRRWVSVGEFGQVVGRVLAGMPAWRRADGTKNGAPVAPWNIAPKNQDWLAEWIAQHKASAEIDTAGYTFEGLASEMDSSWDELERWCGRLEGMAPGQGRNNRLNQIAYYSGAKAVACGHALEVVRARLVEVGEGVGTHGVGATVDSGLRSGLATLKKQGGI